MSDCIVKSKVRLSKQNVDKNKFEMNLLPKRIIYLVNQTFSSHIEFVIIIIPVYFRHEN